jgi:hypothetical protein
LQSLLFLRTLPQRFQAFVEFQKQSQGALGEPHKLIQAAIDYHHTNKGADEADKEGKALWGGSSGASYGGVRGGGKGGRGKGKGGGRGKGKGGSRRGSRGTGRHTGDRPKQKICFNCMETGHIT